MPGGARGQTNLHHASVPPAPLAEGSARDDGTSLRQAPDQAISFLSGATH